MAFWFQQFLGVLIRMWIWLNGIEIRARNEQYIKMLGRSVLMVSNHQRLPDSFYLAYVVNFLNQDLMPVHHIGARVFRTVGLRFLRRIGAVALFYWLSGTISVYRGAGFENNIRGPIECLKSGGTVLVYPEGMTNRTDMPLLPLRTGAAAMAYCSGASVLPTYIHYGDHKVIVEFGKPFTLAENDFTKGTEVIREKLLELMK